MNPGFQKNPLDLRDLYIRIGAAANSSSSGLESGGSSAAQLFGPSSSVTAANTSLASTISASVSNPTVSNSLLGAPIASASAFPNSGQVSLAAFTNVKEMTAPLAINHQGQFPVITLSFNLAPNASLGEAVMTVNLLQQQIGLPPSIQAAFQGTAQAFQNSLSNEWMLILAAIVTVYIVLGVLYESYTHPLTILSTLPSAGVGAVLALLICRNDFSVIALIGLVLLATIALNVYLLSASRRGSFRSRTTAASWVPSRLTRTCRFNR